MPLLDGPPEVEDSAPPTDTSADIPNAIPDVFIDAEATTSPPSVFMQHKLTKSTFNLCDDEKLHLSLITSAAALSTDMLAETGATALVNKAIAANVARDKNYEATGNYCTLPRRPKGSLCSFHTVVFEKGPGRKKLGFTVVGGSDTGALGIFVKNILPSGQAGQDGLLKAGDEILAVNGQVCHDLSHEEAVKLFKSVKCGEIVLQVCRRNKQTKPQITAT